MKAKLIVVFLCLFFLNILESKANGQKDSLMELYQSKTKLSHYLGAIGLSELYQNNDSSLCADYLNEVLLGDPELSIDNFLALAIRKEAIISKLYGQEKAMAFLRPILKKCEEIKDSSGCILLLDVITKHYFQTFQYDSAKHYVDKAIGLVDSTKDTKLTGTLLYRKSIIAYSVGEYAQSLELIFKSISFFQKTEESQNLGLSYLQLGNIFYFLENKSDAEHFFTIGLKYFEKLGNEYGVATCKSNLGLIKVDQGFYREAVNLEMEALPAIIEQKNLIAEGNIYFYLGEAYFGIQKYDSSLYFLKKSTKINQQTKYYAGICFDYLIRAKIFHKQEITDSARQYLEKANAMLKMQPDLDAEKNLVLFESQFYGELKDYEKSYKASQRYFEIKDSLDFDDVKMKLLAVRQKAKLDQIEYELKLAREREKASNYQTSIQKRKTYIITVLAIIFLGLLILGLIFFKKMKKLNEKLLRQKNQIKEELEMKESLVKEIHHRVKNNLQVISSMLNIQSQYLEDAKLIQIIDDCKIRIGSMSLIHESLYKKNDASNISFSNYIGELIPFLIQTYKVDTQKIQAKIDINEFNLSIDESIPCGLIINEIVSNSLKHAFPHGREGWIELNMKKEYNSIHLKIADNGVGLPQHINPNKQDTFGFLLICTLAAQLEADMKVSQDDGLAFDFTWECRDYKMLN